MNISLEDGLIIIKAKNYASKLNGVTSFDVSLLHDNVFVWHRKILAEAYRIDNYLEKIALTSPLNVNSLVRIIETTLNERKHTNCTIFYDGKVCISICVEDFLSFILSLFSLNKTYDFSLAFTSPDSVIVLSDNEYEIELFICKKLVGIGG